MHGALPPLGQSPPHLQHQERPRDEHGISSSEIPP